MKRVMDVGKTHISNSACLFDTTRHIHRALDIKDTRFSGISPTYTFGQLSWQLHMIDSLPLSGKGLFSNLDGAVCIKWSFSLRKVKE